MRYFWESMAEMLTNAAMPLLLFLAAAVWFTGCQSIAAERQKNGDRCLIVTDDVGKPLPGVSFIVFTDKAYRVFGGVKFDRQRRQCVTDRNGMWRGLPSRSLEAGVVESTLGKEGYDYRDWMNYPGNSFPFDKSTVDRPYILRMRRILDEKSFLLDPLDDREKGYYYKSPYYKFKPGAEYEAVPVDIFYGTEETPNVGGGYVHLERYDDFLVRPAYDAASGKWEVSFSVTNAGCGIIATTNRVFMAPADGYQTEVAVPQEVLDHPAFTLYLRTREPRLYAMLPFSRSAHHPNRDLGIAFGTALVNPYGGRELERDGRAANFIYDDLRKEAINALLVKRTYPPKPDMAARVKNYEVWCDLWNTVAGARKNNIAIQRKKEEAIKSRDASSQKVIEECNRKLSEAANQMREWSKKLNEIRKQAHTLNLPEQREVSGDR